MKRTFFSILLLIMFGTTVYGQQNKLKQLPRECEVCFPSPLLNYSKMITQTFISKFEAENYGQNSASSNTQTYVYWDVFSDRSDNVTYSTPKVSKKIYGQLGFMEKVRIAKIKGEFALVFSIPDTEAHFPDLPQNPDWKGWVPMKNLLLWKSATFSDEGVPIKALIEDSACNLGETDSSSTLGKASTNPFAFGKGVSMSKSQRSILYLVKKQGDSSLLATDPYLNEDMSNIYGWVDNASVLFWDTRLCLEPTWELANVTRFSDNNIRCDINSGVDGLLGQIKYNSKHKGTFSSEQYRMGKDYWRFPILTNQGEEGITYAIPSDSGFLTVNNNSTSTTRGSVRINVMFVIDGSRMYEPYFPILAESIHACDRYFSRSVQPYFGSVIYHDSRIGEQSNEICQLQLFNSPAIYDFIDQGGQYGFKENLSEASLMKSIEKALSEGGFSPGEANYIVVIGGRGDNSDYTDNLPETISESLKNLNIKIRGLQVQRNRNISSYNLFNYQLEDLIRSNLASHQNPDDRIISQVQDADKFSSTTFTKSKTLTTVFDKHTHINSGLMTENEFTDFIRELFVSINNDIKANAKGGSSSSNAITAFNKASSAAKDLDGREYFKIVAMYSERELIELVDKMGTLYDELMSTSHQRDSFTKLMKAYTNGALPFSENNKLDDRGFFECLKLLEQANSSMPYYKGTKIKDIASKNMDPEKFRFIAETFSHQYMEMLRILNTQYYYTSNVDGTKYYWVPLEYLP